MSRRYGLDHVPDSSLLDWLSSPENPPAHYLIAWDHFYPPPSDEAFAAVREGAGAGRRAALADASKFLNERAFYDSRLAVSEIGLPQSPVEDAVRRAVEEMLRERPAGAAPRDEAEEDAPAATPEDP